MDPQPARGPGGSLSRQFLLLAPCQDENAAIALRRSVTLLTLCSHLANKLRTFFKQAP